MSQGLSKNKNRETLTNLIADPTFSNKFEDTDNNLPESEIQVEQRREGREEWRKFEIGQKQARKCWRECFSIYL